MDKINKIYIGIIIGLIIIAMALNFSGIIGSQDVFKPSPDDDEVYKSEGNQMIPKADIRNPKVQQVTGTTIESISTKDTWIDVPDMSLTADESGTYQITFKTTARIQHFSDGGGKQLLGYWRIYKNNSTTISSTTLGSWEDDRTTSSLCSITSPINIVSIITLNKGDTIKVQWKLNSGEDIDNIAQSEGDNINVLTMIKIE